jgi:hypothetical protein
MPSFWERVLPLGCDSPHQAAHCHVTCKASRSREGRSVPGPKRDEVTRGWGKLHNEELHNLYYSPSIIRMIKSGRMRWAGNVARIGEKRKSQKERDPGEDEDVGGWIILKWIFERPQSLDGS